MKMLTELQILNSVSLTGMEEEFSYPTAVNVEAMNRFDLEGVVDGEAVFCFESEITHIISGDEISRYSPSSQELYA